MKIILSSNQITELQNEDFKTRQAVLFIAKSFMTPAEKLIVNLIKLTILIPPFIFFARLSGWALAWPALGLLVGYFVLLQPVSLFFARRHISKALKQHQQQLQQ